MKISLSDILAAIDRMNPDDRIIRNLGEFSAVRQRRGLTLKQYLRERIHDVGDLRTTLMDDAIDAQCVDKAASEIVEIVEEVSRG